MKNFIRILYIVIAVVVIAGCSGKNTKEDYDISIISKNKVSLFKLENGSIKLHKEIKRSVYRPQKVRPKNLTFWRSVFLWLNIILNLKRKSY